MSTDVSIAGEIDRLVWAVGDTVRATQTSLPIASTIESGTLGPLFNLLPFRDHLTESVVRRRYVYLPDQVMTTFLDNVTTAGLFTRESDRLVPTERLESIAQELAAAVAAQAREFWRPQEETALAAGLMAERVLRAAGDRDGLVALAQMIEEPADPFHCLFQRLSGLRLVRNEAHAAAWRALGLGPRDVEALTDAWAGTALQAPATMSERLAKAGYVSDSPSEQIVSSAGLEARQQIEDATDAGVKSALDEIDRSAFLDLLSVLPPLGFVH